MRNAGTEVWPKATCKILIVALVLLTAGFAQAPASPVASPIAASASSPGFYDPLHQDTGEVGLKQQLRKLQTTGRWRGGGGGGGGEDGGLLTREARGKGVQTLLMTLTRG